MESSIKIKQGQIDFTGLVLPYKSYVAILNQTGTAAPTPTVIYNDLSGAIVWTYSSVGGYVGTLTGAFTESKTTCIIVNGQAGSGLIGCNRVSDNVISLTTSNSTTAAPSNGMLFDATIEVRVYNSEEMLWKTLSK